MLPSSQKMNTVLHDQSFWEEISFMPSLYWLNQIHKQSFFNMGLMICELMMLLHIKLGSMFIFARETTSSDAMFMIQIDLNPTLFQINQRCCSTLTLYFGLFWLKILHLWTCSNDAHEESHIESLTYNNQRPNYHEKEVGDS